MIAEVVVDGDHRTYARAVIGENGWVRAEESSGGSDWYPRESIDYVTGNVEVEQR